MTEPGAGAVPSGGAARPPDAGDILRSRSYVPVLLLGALLGVPVAAVAYFFLAFVSKAQTLVFTDLPEGLGLDPVPVWWPFLPLLACGLVVGCRSSTSPGPEATRPRRGSTPAGRPTRATCRASSWRPSPRCASAGSSARRRR